MRVALVVLIVVAGLVGSVRSRYIGLLLYVWFALFRPQEWAFDEIDSLRLSVVIWVALMLPSLITLVLPNITHPLSLAMIAFLLCTMLAQLNAASPEAGWIGIQILLTTISVALLAVTIIKTRQQFLGFLAMIGGSIGVHAAQFGGGFLYNGGIRYYAGIGGMFDANNEFALAITRTIFLVIATAQNTDSKWLRRAFFAVVPLSVFAVISTFSREGLLGLITGVLTFAALQRRRFLTVGALAIATWLVLVAAPVPQDYFRRMETIRTYEEVQEESALSRLHYWRVALEMAKDNPFGVGVKNFERVYDRYDFLNGQYGRARATHNTLLQVLAETGIPGLLVFVFLLTYGFWLCLRLRRRALTPGLSERDQRFMTTVGNALVASLAAFVVGSTFASQMLTDLNWLTLALIASADRVSRTMVASATDSATTEAAAIPQWRFNEDPIQP